MEVIAGDGALRDTLHEALLACVGRWGLSKTTLEDVAREAGCSRATVYRTVAGGKGALVAGTVRHEARRFRATLEQAIAGADDLEELVVAGVHATASFLHGHGALRYLLQHEPDVVLPHVAFDRLDGVLDVATALASPHLAPHLGGDDALAARASEWVARVVLSFLLNPSPTLDLTTTDGARRLAHTHLLPGLASMRARSAEPTPTTTGGTP